MTTDAQSVLAMAIVLLTTGIVLYFSFIKKKSGCGGCDCGSETKKFPSSKKK
jgi:hypothetical protein